MLFQISLGPRGLKHAHLGLSAIGAALGQHHFAVPVIQAQFEVVGIDAGLIEGSGR